MRTRNGIAPRAVRESIRLAAQCRCVPVNSDVEAVFLVQKLEMNSSMKKLTSQNRAYGAIGTSGMVKALSICPVQSECGLKIQPRYTL